MPMGRQTREARNSLRFIFDARSNNRPSTIGL